MDNQRLREHQLTPDQVETLVQIVCDEYGNSLGRPAFTDAMLKLFEDVAGFETLTVTLRRKYLNVLWRRYESTGGSSTRDDSRKP